MSAEPEFPGKPGSLADRRQRLALACELDRLHLKIAFAKKSGRELQIAGVPLSTFSKAFSVAQLLPGTIGRWSRRLSLGAELFSAFNPFTRR